MFYNALGYAVELGRLASNPIDRIQWTAPAVAQTVDRRVVVSPAQARKLLAAVRGLSDRGAHLEAFYGCLYYAAHAEVLRVSENCFGSMPCASAQLCRDSAATCHCAGLPCP